MKRMIAIVLTLGLLAGCQKKTETQQQAQTAPPPSPAETSPAKDTNERQKPAMRPSDARVTVDPVNVSKGQKGNFQIKYQGVETAKAIVVPLQVPAGMKLDSASFGGSIIAYLANKPVRINNELHTILMAAIPVTEPRIPPKEGLLATVYFTMSPDAVSGNIKETFVPPGNYLSYVDTTNTLVEPYFEGGQVTVK